MSSEDRNDDAVEGRRSLSQVFGSMSALNNHHQQSDSDSSNDCDIFHEVKCKKTDKQHDRRHHSSYSSNSDVEDFSNLSNPTCSGASTINVDPHYSLVYPQPHNMNPQLYKGEWYSNFISRRNNLNNALDALPIPSFGVERMNEMSRYAMIDFLEFDPKPEPAPIIYPEPHSMYPERYKGDWYPNFVGRRNKLAEALDAQHRTMVARRNKADAQHRTMH